MICAAGARPGAARHRTPPSAAAWSPGSARGPSRSSLAGRRPRSPSRCRGADARRRLGRLGRLARARRRPRRAVRLAAAARRRPRALVGRRAAGATLGRPALAGDRLLFHVAGTVEQPDRPDPTRSGAAARCAGPARAAAQPVQRRRPAALRALDLPAPAAADRAAQRRGRSRGDRSLYGTVPTGRRDAGYEPGVSTTHHGHPAEAPAAAAAQRLADTLDAPRSAATPPT